MKSEQNGIKKAYKAILRLCASIAVFLLMNRKMVMPSKLLMEFFLQFYGRWLFLKETSYNWQVGATWSTACLVLGDNFSSLGNLSDPSLC